MIAYQQTFGFAAPPPPRILVGDVREQLRLLAAESVHCVVTSPPYWGLRDYGLPASVWGGDPEHEHEWGDELEKRGGARYKDGQKAKWQHGDRGEHPKGHAPAPAGSWCACGAWRGTLGLEPDPELYLAHMVVVFAEVWRVLRPEGTLWLNMGDSYAANGIGAKNDGLAAWSAEHARGGAHKMAGQHVRRQLAGLKAKDLVGLPWRVAFALQAAGWWLRADIIWAKPNAMPESVRDRPIKAHEYVFLMTKARRYFYDAEAVKERVTGGSHARGDGVNPKAAKYPAGWDGEVGGGHHRKNGRYPRPRQNSSWSSAVVDLVADRNKRDVWEIPTQPYPGAHFATFPEKLVEPCVLAGTSAKGCCPSCGAPWRRVVARERTLDGEPAPHLVHDKTKDLAVPWRAQGVGKWRIGVATAEHGWEPTCGCADGLQPDDLEIIATPIGIAAGADPTLVRGRRGFGRPRSGSAGHRELTRYQQRQYAVQLRDLMNTDLSAGLIEEAGGKTTMDHYLRLDRSGARPVPAGLLDAWIERGVLREVPEPSAAPLEPVPCVVLDPFAGSGTVLAVAGRAGRRSIGVELNPSYVELIRERCGLAPLTGAGDPE